MIKYYSILALALFAALQLQAQNLVVNPSFENTNSNCANFGGEGFRADLGPDWDNANSNAAGDSCSSPDLYAPCNIAFTKSPGGGMGALGFQYAHTGTRYVGLITYEVISSTYREYIQGRTSSPLVAGQKYCVSMYVSLADFVPFATNNIGVYFSNTRYMRDACTQGAIINVTPQLNYGCGTITDTSENWVRLQWDYTAAGGEQFFTIGNFYGNSNTTIQNTGNPSFPNDFAYYFIDDVSIVPNTCCYADIAKSGPFCISDPATNLIATTGTGTSCSPNITGTWSGPGITNASLGTFNPSIAGVGTHTITFTLSCGSSYTTSISVNSCTAISVCKETNGDLTVSGGTPVFKWSYWQPATSTTITTQAQCTACGGSWMFGQCLSGITPITSCSTPAQWVQYATGATATPPTGKDSIKVEDNAGTKIVISNIAAVAPCTACPSISLSVQSKQDATCVSANSGSATFSATGGTGAYTYVWQPNVSTTATASNIAAGTYNVTATDANGCTGTGSVTINAAPAPSLTLGTPTNPSCGQANGSVSATLAGGTAPYQVTIDNGQGSPQTQTVPMAGTAPVSNLAAGTYTITVRDANNCTTSQTLTLTAPNSPTINPVNVTAETCAGQNNGSIVSATATGEAGTLQWSYAPAATPNNTTNISSFPVNNLAAGNYIIFVRDANSCTASQTFTIAAGANCCNLNLAVSTTQPSCGQADGGITVTASPAGTYTYTWSNSLPNQATQSSLAAGQYRVTVSETANPSCTKDTVINLNPSNGPTLSFSNQVNPGCGQTNGSVSITLAGGTAPYQVTIDDGQGSPQTQTVPIAGTAPVGNLAAGSYTITVNDANSCSVVQTLTLTAPNPPVITSINATAETCAGDNNGTANVVVNGGNGALTYTWSNSGSAASINNLSPGVYKITVTDTANCSATDSVTVSAGPVCCTVNISAAITQPSCGNNDGGINLTVLPAATYTYTWSNGNSTANNSGLGAGTYSVTVTNTGNNCTKDTTFSLSNPNAPTVSNLTSTPESCTGNDGTASLTASGGTGTLTITWSNGNSGNSISLLTAGNYSYTVTDQNSCQATGTVTVAPAVGCCFMQASVATIATSCGENNGSISVSITTNGTAPYQYSTNGSSYQQADSFTNLSGGDYTVYVLDANSCADTLTLVNVGISSNTLAINFNTIDPGCAGANSGSIGAQVTGGTPAYTYTWSNGASDSILSNLAAGTYSLTVTDNNSCSFSSSASLNATQPFSISLGNDTAFCAGGNALLNAPSGYAAYAWSSGDTTQQINVAQSGTYSVTVSNSGGCTAAASVHVTVTPLPIIDLPTDTTMFENNPIMLVPIITGNATGEYVWTPDEDISCLNCAQPVVNPTDTTIYVLRFTDASKCPATATIKVNVVKGGDIYMPNVFSPNGDGNNDIFKPLGFNVKHILWKVFNRWGELVFQSDDFNIGWDGMFKSSPQPAGVYVYTMDVTFQNKVVKHYKGSFTLIK